MVNDTERVRRMRELVGNWSGVRYVRWVDDRGECGAAVGDVDHTEAEIWELVLMIIPLSSLIFFPGVDKLKRSWSFGYFLDCVIICAFLKLNVGTVARNTKMLLDADVQCHGQQRTVFGSIDELGVFQMSQSGLQADIETLKEEFNSIKTTDERVVMLLVVLIFSIS